jgi:tetratricopeptide (TPR) repeat protein
MNLEKLKDSARKFEQKEDWRKAIEVYLKAIQQIESGAETSPDLSLYNRVGDLYLKINDTAAAVRSYERAVDLYADQGFFNNAIALCGKILRVNPGRTQTYLKLAQLHARKNVVIEAKRNLIEFLERMNALGQLDQAFQSIKEFADQFSGSQEIRMMLVDLLRAASREEEALEQLAKIAGDIEARDGGASAPAAASPGMHAPASPRPRAPGAAPGRGDLVFLDTGFEVPPVPAASAPGGEPAALAEVPPPPGLEPTGAVYDVVETGGELILDPLTAAAGADAAPPPELLPPAGLEQTSEADLELEAVGPLPGLEQDPSADGIELDELTLDDLEVQDTAIPDDLDLDMLEGDAPAAPTAGLPLIDDAPTGALADELAGLEDRIADDPGNPDLHRELADRLLLQGELGRAAEELRLALQAYEGAADWPGASAVAERLVALEPDAIHNHQKRVELAFRSGERAPLLEAYLALGDALGRAGAVDKALAVYGRVQEHDPSNRHAAAAIAALGSPRAAPASPAMPAAPARIGPEAPAAEAPVVETPVAKPPARGGDFVDLGSMILDEAGPRDTRMRIDRREPQGDDEQREFQEILEQFKRGIDENLDTDDYEAHYDLGVAFKEMGLLDEAIAEFQKALRAPDGRLRTSEALGIAFYDKRQFAVSEAVLRRAVDGVEGGDEAKIGLIYWLGRALEAQGKDQDAITSYERAMAVDIRFMDLGERVHRLAAGRRS